MLLFRSRARTLGSTPWLRPIGCLQMFWRPSRKTPVVVRSREGPIGDHGPLWSVPRPSETDAGTTKLLQLHCSACVLSSWWFSGWSSSTRWSLGPLEGLNQHYNVVGAWYQGPCSHNLRKYVRWVYYISHLLILRVGSQMAWFTNLLTICWLGVMFVINYVIIIICIKLYNT